MSDFGWCNFCVLDLKKKKDCQDLKLVVPSISSKSFEMAEEGKFRIQNSMVQNSVGGECKLRICEFSY